MNAVKLWENEMFEVITPKNPHLSYLEGMHLIVSPKLQYSSAWSNIDNSTKAFELSSRVCKIIEEIGLATWFNIQANGNWGLLPGNTPFFHVHIYSRNKTACWGKPVVLPEAPGTYQNDPMPIADQNKLTEALSKSL
jgi:diadenosine tetraphosphate (Ap4A) HIT family hydrolase